jgi:RHS repeat-associated protein
VSARSSCRRSRQHDSTTYTWDFENRLTNVNLPGNGGTVSFKYDPFGRGIYKQSPNATNIFVYDGESLAETVNSSGGTVARQVQGQDIDESLGLRFGTTTDYYQADVLGSVTSLTASDGSLAQSYTYDSFGNLANSTGSAKNFFRHVARDFDTETGLYDYRARFYDSNVGRFLSEDPLGFYGGADFYAYTADNPVNLVDPSGMVPESGNGGGLWPPANLNDPALAPTSQWPYPSTGQSFGGSQQCVALTRHFTGLPCSDCWRAGPKVIGNNPPPGTPIATFDQNGRHPQQGSDRNFGLYVHTYGDRIVIIDQRPPDPRRGPARPAGGRVLRPTPDRSDNPGSYSAVTVPRGTTSSKCKCGNW